MGKKMNPYFYPFSDAVAEEKNYPFLERWGGGLPTPPFSKVKRKPCCVCVCVCVWFCGWRSGLGMTLWRNHFNHQAKPRDGYCSHVTRHFIYKGQSFSMPVLGW